MNAVETRRFNERLELNDSLSRRQYSMPKSGGVSIDPSNLSSRFASTVSHNIAMALLWETVFNTLTTRQRPRNTVPIVHEQRSHWRCYDSRSLICALTVTANQAAKLDEDGQRDTKNHSGPKKIMVISTWTIVKIALLCLFTQTNCV